MEPPTKKCCNQCFSPGKWPYQTGNDVPYCMLEACTCHSSPDAMEGNTLDKIAKSGQRINPEAIFEAGKALREDDAMEGDIEALSAEIHQLYCAQYLKDKGEPYHTNGDYTKLKESTKEYDRNIARFIRSRFLSKAAIAAAIEKRRGELTTNELYQYFGKYTPTGAYGLALDQLLSDLGL